MEGQWVGRRTVGQMEGPYDVFGCGLQNGCLSLKAHVEGGTFPLTCNLFFAKVTLMPVPSLRNMQCMACEGPTILYVQNISENWQEAMNYAKEKLPTIYMYDHKNYLQENWLSHFGKRPNQLDCHTSTAVKGTFSLGCRSSKTCLLRYLAFCCSSLGKSYRGNLGRSRVSGWAVAWKIRLRQCQTPGRSSLA